MNDISNTIATAVEEQNATTNEMARNVSEAARGASEISNNIAGVASAAENTAQGSNDSAQASKALAEMSTKLQKLVSQFKLDAGDKGRGKNSETIRRGPRRPMQACKVTRLVVLASESMTHLVFRKRKRY